VKKYFAQITSRSSPIDAKKKTKRKLERKVQQTTKWKKKTAGKKKYKVLQTFIVGVDELIKLSGLRL